MKHSCLGVFLAFLFVIFFFVAFILFNFKATFFNVNFYKTEFVKTNLYSQLADTIPKIIEKSASQKGGQTSEAKQFAEIAKKAITPTWLKQETEKNLTNIFNWFYGRTSTLKIDISLIPIKGEFEKEFFAELKKDYDNLPECTSKSQSSSVSCRVPGKSFDEAQKEILQKMGSNNPINQFPNKFEWSPPASQAALPFFAQAGAISRIINWVFYIFSTLAVLMLVILAILSRKSLRSMFRWLGIPLAIPSFLLLVTFGIARIFAGAAVGRLSGTLAATSGGVGADFGTSLITSLASRIVLDIGNTKLLEAGAIFGLATVLIIISFFFKKVAVEPPISTPPAKTDFPTG